MSSMDILEMLPQDIIEYIFKLKHELEITETNKENYKLVINQIPSAAKRKLKCWAYNGDIYWGFGRKVLPKNGFFQFK